MSDIPDDLRRLLSELTVALDDEGPRTPGHAKAAAIAANTLALYLQTCLNQACRATVPDLQHLATLLTVLGSIVNLLANALTGPMAALDSRVLPASTERYDITQVAELRAQLDHANRLLATAAHALHTAHRAATRHPGAEGNPASTT